MESLVAIGHALTPLLDYPDCIPLHIMESVRQVTNVLDPKNTLSPANSRAVIAGEGADRSSVGHHQAANTRPGDYPT